MKKLAVFRSNDDDPCPFGLLIPSACHSAGDLIKRMAPIEVLGDEATEEEIIALEEANNNLLKKRSINERCYFAGSFIKQTVECTRGENNEGDIDGSALVGSPFYQKNFSGTAVDGMYSVPLGYYSESVVDRKPYYGSFSFEGLANINELSRGKNMKIAQNMDGISVKVHPDHNDLRYEISIAPESPEEEAALAPGGDVSGELTINLEDGEIKKEFDFNLPSVPGGDFQDDIATFDVKEPEPVQVESDPWKWETKQFLPWLQDKLRNIPKHSGKDTAGIERAVAYLEFLNKEISRAVRTDLKNEIAIEAVEAARDEIMKGIDRLEERKEQIESSKYPSKRKKRAEEIAAGLVKEGSMAVGGVTVTVSLLISTLARSLINGTVSAGHDMNESYKKVCDEYSLTKREKLELQSILHDMNFPLRRDFGMPLDKETDTKSSDNVNFSAQYPA